MLLVGALVLAAPSRAATSVPGCELVFPAASSCTYVATQVQSWVGNGPFHLRVAFTDGSGRLRTRYEVNQPAGPATSAGLTDAQQVGIGDTVTATVLGPGAFLGIGNPGAVPNSGLHAGPVAPRLKGNTTPVHDPAIAFEHGWYYLYVTGTGIPVRRSRDLVHWIGDGQVFPNNLPAWAPKLIPGTQSPWAPDLSFFGGKWHLYYAISTFGAKRSAVGHAVNATLDRRDPRYGWHDLGPVVASTELADPSAVPTDDNALDPNVILDDTGAPHLVFGSFYGGIKELALDPVTGAANQSVLPTPLAANVQEYTAVEGAFVIRRDGWYYLFASYDYCCRGTDSTYNVRVGRSRSVSGPFVDDLGIPMLTGGGRYVLTSGGDMRGPGHNAIIRRGNQYDIVFHWYDAANKATPTLGILPLHWTADGWPST
ncbi:MAG TPA: arabinan endo-1,5-alpha-L-arabinosidase [Acidimicrobiales bacterium]|nr:arabinan endo-1,5-alpha-L-arabinosidase [Acidimicrobiales bacterium]